MSQLKVIADKLNKRNAVPVTLPDNSSIAGIVYRDYNFEGDLACSNQLGDWYKDRDNHYYWGKGLLISTVADKASNAANNLVTAPALDLPLSHGECIACAGWMKLHFGDQMGDMLSSTSFNSELLYAIACQETAIYWCHWMNDHTPAEILARCVFDASGDANGTRSVFPQNTPVFRSHFGDALTTMLIAEANATRSLRGWGNKEWVYAGYGIFQYDIQSILTDQVFFEEKQWYQIEYCLKRVIKELSEKWALHSGDLFSTVKAYNGSGQHATAYAKNVLQFLDWIKNG